MLDQTTHYSLLKTLEENPGLSQRELAKKLGVSLGKVNYCLNALVEKGSIKIDNFRKSDNKLAYAYLLTPRGIESKARMTVQFLKRKVQEYEQLRNEIEELRREAAEKGAGEGGMNGANHANAHAPANQPAPDTVQAIRDVLREFPQIRLAIVFGSAVTGHLRPDSDLDLAVLADTALSEAEKITLIGALACRTGRPIDLIDLKTVTEPLLGQIVRHGKRVIGGDTLFGNLISRHLFEQADFMPYRRRLLAERRNAWIGK